VESEYLLLPLDRQLEEKLLQFCAQVELLSLLPNE
jgi:hypothetical protein